ncbi:IclR family transcriptional regulator [Aquabacterium commune]|uniref:IclR family transcriptional regulator n=1 Tax=Aquabacterium commune TaxID=70586 RepID=A0A4R6RHZ9_9BURK|nr:IclR family transcriptional regulator C-terminal domain-containing protein [Aquabacterium commune]TDP86099.1 IclR family transcriptional regulator [Aquabacterium commune]
MATRSRTPLPAARLEAPEAPASDAQRPSDSHVQSFARGLEVLRSFGANAPTQTLSEAAERTGLTRAGARRILLTLQGLGYVAQEGRDFRLTPKVLELGFAYLASQPWWHVAQPLMEDLTQTLHESSSAAVLDGDEIVYVLRVPAHKIMSINLGVGSRLPAHCSSMGRVLLAGLPEDERERRVMAMHLTAKTPKTVTDPDRLLSVLGDVRRKGFALVSEELELGLMSLAVPVTDRQGRVVAALNVSTQPQRRTATELREQCLPMLQAVAKRIGETMAR